MSIVFSCYEVGSFVLEVVGNVYFIKNFFPVSIWEIGRASVALETFGF